MQKKVETQTAETEIWQKIFDSLDDIVTLQDKNMRIVRANKKAYEVLGVNDSIVGKLCYQVFSGINNPCFGCPELSTLMDTGRHSRIIRHAKLGKVFQVSSNPIVNCDNEIEYIVHLARDITEQQKTEAELALFHSLVNQSNDAIFIINPDTGYFLYVNDKGCENLGYTQEEFLQLTVPDIDTSLTSQEHWIKRMAVIKEQGIKIFETSQRRKDNTVLPVEVNVRFLVHKGKKYLISIARDITERKKAEENLLLEKNKLESLVGALGDGVTFQDRNFNIVYQNETHIKKQGSHLGEKCYQAYQGRDDICEGCLLVRCFEDGKIHRREINAKTDKGMLYFEVSASPVKDSHGEIIGGIETTRDITDRKKMELQFQQAQKMEAIGTLAGGIAHDFNNILSSIIGYTELAMIESQEFTSVIQKLENVLIAAQRARDLVKQILTFSRHEIHKKLPVEPYIIVKESLKLLRASIPTTIAIHEDIDPASGFIMADPTQIHQIIINLCTNSLHAMESEKGILTIELARREVEASDVEYGVEAGPFIELKVADTGHGISKEDMERIFDPFFTTKEIGKGTGLGLAMVHGIVEEYGGMIKIDSTEGQGTTVRVFFPVLDERDEASSEVEEESANTGTERILVIDDEEAIAVMQKAILERLGYTVSAETSSLAAYEEFKQHPEAFDLIITDQTMPKMAGDEFVKEILSIRPDIPIILSTGYSTILTEERIDELGIKKIMMKPISAYELATVVRQVLDEQDNL